jgi:D-3-phosphoglycerate dehydrogenase
MFAEERGIAVAQTQEGRHPNFGELITVSVRTSSTTRVVAGTVFEGIGAKIVLIDGVLLNADPSGHLLIVYNDDKPGVVGTLGTVLERYGVNIAGIYLGRQHTGGKAVSVLNVDSEVPAAALEEMKRDPRVNEAVLAKL